MNISVPANNPFSCNTNKLVFVLVALTGSLAVINSQGSRNAAVILFFLLLFFYRKELKTVFLNALGITVLLYVAYVALAITWSSDPDNGFFILRYALVWLLLPVLIYFFSQNDRYARWSFWALLVGFKIVVISVLLMRYGIIEPHQNAQAAGGVRYFKGMNYIDINYHAGVFSLIAFYFTVRSFFQKQKGWMFYWFVWFVLGCAALFSLESRGGHIAFLVAFLLLWIFLIPNRRWLAVTSGIVLTLCLALAAWQLSPTIQQRVGATLKEFKKIDKGNLSSSFGQRLAMWKLGIAVWMENPVLGAGTGARQSVKEVLHEKRPDLVRFIGKRHHRWSHNLHNQYIETLKQHGALGALLLSALFLIIVGKLIPASVESRILGGVLLVHLAVAAIPSAPLHKLHVVLVLVILLAYLISRNRDDSQTSGQYRHSHLPA